MTPNIKKNRIMIRVTLAMFGIAKKRALTAIFKPSFLLMILRILKTLKAVKSSERGVMDITENTMIEKSMTFSILLR